MSLSHSLLNSGRPAKALPLFKQVADSIERSDVAADSLDMTVYAYCWGRAVVYLRCV